MKIPDMKRIVITVVTGCLFNISVYSQNFDKAKLDKYFDALETNNKFMGSVALSKNGSVIYTRSVGFSDVKSQQKANENTKYRIGSISKTFTSILVQKAVEEKGLNPDQTIEGYFPSIKNAGKITIRHLLTHRSGIHNFTNDADYTTWMTQPKTESEMVAIIAKPESDFEPGSKADYSNSNYVLLTYILQKTFKMPYSELLKKYIADPIGLKNTYVGQKINVKSNEANSYSFAGDWTIEAETDMSVPMGAGAVISTPTDLVKMSNTLFHGKLITEKSVELMKTIKDDYGAGLFKFPFGDKQGFGHTGGIDGFSSVFTYFPDEDVSYALTCNGENYNTNNISIAVLSAVYNQPYEIPEFKTVDVKTEDLDKYLGVYASQQIPLKITVTKDNKNLVAQATGQSSFPLQATGENKFEFSQAGIVLEFDPAKNAMVLKQGGGKYNFVKQ